MAGFYQGTRWEAFAEVTNPILRQGFVQPLAEWEAVAAVGGVLRQPVASMRAYATHDQVVLTDDDLELPEVVPTDIVLEVPKQEELEALYELPDEGDSGEPYRPDPVESAP